MPKNSAKAPVDKGKEIKMSFKKYFSKLARRVTGKIAPEDLPELDTIITHNFYDRETKEYTAAIAHRQQDGTWDARITRGQQKNTQSSNQGDFLGQGLTLERAVTTLESFEKAQTRETQKRCLNTVINRPLVEKVRKSL